MLSWLRVNQVWNSRPRALSRMWMMRQKNLESMAYLTTPLPSTTSPQRNLRLTQQAQYGGFGLMMSVDHQEMKPATLGRRAQDNRSTQMRPMRHSAATMPGSRNTAISCDQAERSADGPERSARARCCIAGQHGNKIPQTARSRCGQDDGRASLRK